MAERWRCTACGLAGIAPTVAQAAVELTRHVGRAHGDGPVDGVLPAAVLSLPSVPGPSRGAIR